MRVERIGSATLYLGDCREVLPTLEGVDAVVTDPPYGVVFAGKSTKHTARDNIGYSGFEDTPDYIRSVCVPIIVQCIDRFGRVVMTPGLRMAFAYPEPQNMGTIFYPSGAGMGKWGFTCSQPIFYYGKCPYLAKSMGSRPDSFESVESAPPNGHPCPKPEGVMKWLISRASLIGDTILDPFLGSGTTGVACSKLGRSFIGIEIEPKYFDIACRRIEAAQRQSDLFVQAPVAPQPVTGDLFT